ncbi:HslU--HslV peptidase proteolytic subunit, partial [Francisella tularensis subsp. holarctica]|nr:HslU--HslV peptidase proteolytic subunit [Francisella tularensis subsp. holarctica]
EWRLDRMLSKLESMISVADEKLSLLISGAGEVMAADKNDIISIGTGSTYARSAATALFENTDLSAEENVRKSLTIA